MMNSVVLVKLSLNPNIVFVKKKKKKIYVFIADKVDSARIRLDECNDNSIWYINGNEIISAIDSKC